MTHDTILFLTDTHAGDHPPAWTQQPPRPDLLPAICAGVRGLVESRGIDLVVHGGDVTDHIDLAGALRFIDDLDVPAAACLGNHDLMIHDAYDVWRGLAPEHLRLADAVVPLEHVDLVLLNCAWMHQGRAGLFWDGNFPVEALTDAQAEWLDATLAATPGKPACLVVHAPLDPLPPRLTGLPEDAHVPDADYAASLGRLLDHHPRVRLVLAGHSHVTCAARRGGRVHLSTSAVIEAPFEVRLVRFSRDAIRVETVPAIPMPADAAYDAQKAWVNGRPEDRTVEIRW